MASLPIGKMTLAEKQLTLLSTLIREWEKGKGRMRNFRNRLEIEDSHSLRRVRMLAAALLLAA